MASHRLSHDSLGRRTRRGAAERDLRCLPQQAAPPDCGGAWPSDGTYSSGCSRKPNREAPGEGGWNATARLTGRGLKGVWSQIGRAQMAGKPSKACGKIDGFILLKSWLDKAQAISHPSLSRETPLAEILRIRRTWCPPVFFNCSEVTGTRTAGARLTDEEHNELANKVFKVAPRNWREKC
jgi:hypothetical protein